MLVLGGIEHEHEHEHEHEDEDEDDYEGGSFAKARTGKVPIPFTFTGTAKKRALRSGTAARLQRCSTMGMPAPSNAEWTGRVPSSIESRWNESVPTRTTPASTNCRASAPVR